MSDLFEAIKAECANSGGCSEGCKLYTPLDDECGLMTCLLDIDAPCDWNAEVIKKRLGIEQ